jgi:DnaJ domain
MAELVRGSVTDRPWGRTLATIGLRGMSGQLTVYADGREYAVVFSQGAVVGAFSPLPADAIARVALTAGLLTANEVTEVSRRQSHDDGTDLVAEVGRLTPDQVTRLRRRATAHRAARTFSLERGDFVLTDTVTAGWHPDSAVDVRAVIYLGARLTLSEQRLASDLGLLGASFRLRDDAIADLPQFGLSDVERPVLAVLRQGASLLAIEQAAAELDQRTVRAILYALACGGAVDAIGELYGQQGAPQPGAPQQGTPQPRPPSPAIPRTRTGNSHEVAPPRTTTPGQPLPRTTTPSGPSMPRTFTPGFSTRPPSPPTQPPPIATARTTTGTSRPPVPPSQPPLNQPRTTTPMPAGSRPPEARAHTPIDPPRTTTPPPPRRTIATSPGSAYVDVRNNADVRVPTATGAPPNKNPLAVSELQSLVRAKTSLVDQGADHFLLLGVKPDAPIEVIRAAFYGLVRRIHPDLLVAAGMAITDEAQRLMARLNEAYAVLNSPERRREYELTLHLGGDSGRAAELVSAVLTAEERFRRGQAALRRDDLEEAAREFETALELKKDEGDYLALLTWTRFCLAADKEAAAPPARQALEKASRMSPESVTPRFWYGRLERMLGRSQQALTHFRWVLDQEPRHAEAAAEVRLLMSREPQGRTPTPRVKR